MVRRINVPAVPALPVAPPTYNPTWGSSTLNVLRLYFNQITNFLGALMGSSGGRFLNFPNLFMHNPNRQYAGGDNTPTQVVFSTVDSIEGFTSVAGAAKPTYDGAYRVDYRLLFENNDTTSRSVWVWVQVNGEDVENTCDKYSVPSGEYVSATGAIEFDLVGGDEITLLWATNKAYNSIGPVAGVWMDAYNASTSPFNRPAIPSAYGSITFVSGLS